jgi:hypothetical protein
MRTTPSLLSLLVASLLLACEQVPGDAPSPTAKATPSPHNTLTEAERAAGWRLLFDGETTAGWRGAGQDSFPHARWRVEEGTLMVVGEADGFASIVTEEQFDAFELALEFKIQAGANSGIKYFVVEQDPPTPGRGLGLEYQIWDDRQAREATRKMAALFDVIPADGAAQRAYDTFNDARIVVRGDSVEHWLNGRRVLAFVRGNDDFRRRIAASKYRDLGGFGLAPRGHILLQDEGGHRVWFRNIKLRAL